MERKDSREMENGVGNIQKRDSRKEHRSMSMNREGDITTSEEQKKSADYNMLSAEINCLYSVLREVEAKVVEGRERGKRKKIKLGFQA